MGRYKFKLSNMIPNAWFYKLKDMSSSINGGHKKKGSSNTAPKVSFPPPLPSVVNPGRTSYYIPRRDDGSPELLPFRRKGLDTKFLIDPPRKSKKKTRKPSTQLVRSSNSSLCSYPSLLDDDSHLPSRSSSSSGSRATSSSLPDNTTVDLSISSSSKSFDLPPIVTRRGGGGGGEPPTPKKRPPQKSPRGVRLRGNSPRLAWRKKGSTSESFAVVVKMSSDPRQDFRESMLEMIVESGIGTLDDLEELLVCFLSLNSPEYHDVIVQVFQKIWLDLSTTTTTDHIRCPEALKHPTGINGDVIKY